MPNERIFKKGSYVFIENDENSSSVFFVKKGRVSHLCSTPGLSSALKDAGEGDFFGFISSFSGRPRLSSAVAVEDSVLLQIEGDQLFKMLREKTAIAVKIMSSYSHALKHYDSILLDINPISLIYPHNLSLLKIGEFYMEKGENLLAEYIFNRYIQLYPDSGNIVEIEKKIISIGGDTELGFYSENSRGDLVYKDGSVIFCEHEPGDFLYFIREGKVKIMKQSGDRDMLIAVLKEGEIFGELALITSSPRSATAVSFGGVVITPVDITLFHDMLTKSPDIIKSIMKSISQRLWFNHIRLGHMIYKNPVTRLFAFLESKLLEDNVSLTRKIPYQFQFGLDELLEMNELSAEHDADAVNELVSNRYLSFNFGTINVLNPNQFSLSVQMYKHRDRYPAKKHTAVKCGDPAENDDDKALEIVEPHGLIKDEIIRTIPELSDDDPSKRVNAIIKLGNFGDQSKDAVPFIRERLGDSVKTIRKHAARSIVKILPPGESFRLFQDALDEGNQDVRSSALAGLSELNAADRTDIISLIIKSIKDRSPVVRSSAVRSIGTFGSEAEHAVPALIRLLSDSESSVRILSVNSLEKITWTGKYMDEVIDAVKSLVKNDEDKFVKISGRDALVKLNRRNKSRLGNL